MIFCSLLLLILLLFFPEIAMTGSRYGATLWLTQLIPTLLPFFIAIRLFSTCMPHLSAKRPFLLLGLLCGYPAGASLVTEQYNKGLISKRQAYFFLGSVNNPSPMFVLVFCGQTVLAISKTEATFLFLFLLLTSFLGSGIFFLLNRSKNTKFISLDSSSSPKTTSNPSTISEKIDAIILDSFTLIVKIGGYVILFSILGQFLISILPKDSILSILFTGFLEITSGVSYLKHSPLSFELKKVLILVILSFGGLSATAQTGSVLTQSKLSLFPYVVNKGLNSLLAGAIGYLLFCIF